MRPALLESFMAWQVWVVIYTVFRYNISEQLCLEGGRALGYNDFNELGKQINRTVNNALNSANLQGLKNVRDSIDASFRNAGAGAQPGRNGGQNPRNNAGGAQNNAWSAPNSQYKQYKGANNQNRSAPYSNYKPQAYAVPRPKRDTAGKAAGIVLNVLGAIFLAASFFGLVGMLPKVFTANEVFPVAEIAAVSIYGVMAVGGGVMISCGIGLGQRAKRYALYWRAIGTCKFCTLKQLTETANCTEKYLRKDLKKMMRRGLFPGAKFDKEETCLILDEATYQQYLQAAESRTLREREEEERKRRAAEQPEISAVVEEGQKYIKSIREANDALPGVEVSGKLDRLEEVASRIFSYVEQHPNKLPEIRRFMNYYLPTSLKLVSAYREFEAQPVQGENLAAAKREILETLDTINHAYENLLDRLYEDDTLDISTDISALETMLAQEGLTDDDFKNNK